MTYEDILLSKKGHVSIITINRLKQLNAIRYQTIKEIMDALDTLVFDEMTRVLVITGAGDKAFMAGSDISAAEKLSLDQAMKEHLAGQTMCSTVENFPKPVIARINGIALGGGTELALSCDIRIAADTAIMGFPEITLGMIPGHGGTQRLPRAVGMGKAKQIIFTGAHISAKEAYRIGLVDEVVPKEELDSAISAFCEKIAAMSPLILRMAKEAINEGMHTDLKTAMAIETRTFMRCFSSEDCREGMRAFLEKRKPDFKGC